MKRFLLWLAVADCVIAGVLFYFTFLSEDPFEVLPVMRASVGFWNLRLGLIYPIAFFVVALIAIAYWFYLAIYSNSENANERRDTNGWIQATQRDISGR